MSQIKALPAELDNILHVRRYGAESMEAAPDLNRSEETRNMQTESEALLEALRQWRAAGKAAALATVVSTWGSSPRPEGSHLAVDEAGHFLGSVSGGCIEGAVIDAALEVMASRTPRLLEFGVSDEQAWQVGLACGGRVQVFVEPVE